jgi:O-antigen ligase
MKSDDILSWTLVAGGAAGLAAAIFAWGAPDIFCPTLLVIPFLIIIAVAAACPAHATLIWLLALATSPEMWLGDLIDRMPLIIGIDKAIGLVLLGLCVIRYGARLDVFNPALAFLAIFAAGFVHGFWPGLTAADSLRSLIGAAAPFAFSWSRLSADWSRRVIAAAIFSPFAILGLGVCLAGLGLRPLYSLAGGDLRLGASTHPAFLAGFLLISVYALLLEQVREARHWRLGLLGFDVLLLLATGARSPLGIALVMILLVVACVPSVGWPWRMRIPVLLGLAAALPAAVLAAPFLGFLRLFSLAAQGDIGDLTHRTLIWTVYEAAVAHSPWVGWGLGTDKVLVPVGTVLWDLIGTNAAHDEYLRIAVDGGVLGLGLLVLCLVLWLRQGIRRMRRPERAVMILVFLAFAVHSTTDNTLIATTASLMFAWVSAVFARAAAEAPARQLRPLAGRLMLGNG